MNLMLPNFDIDISVGPINPDLLRVIWTDEVVDEGNGIGDNRQYADLSGADWSDVEPTIAAEEALLKTVAARAGDASDFDRMLDELIAEQYPGDDFDEGPLSPFVLLDAGVMAAVASVAAAGCISTTSCRGHARRGEPYPFVRFTTDEYRLPLIHEACVRSGCGLEMDHSGMLQLYAQDVLALVKFARNMFLMRGSFDAIEANVACERPADEYLEDYDDDVRRRDLYAIHEKMAHDRIVNHPGQLSLFGDETGSP